MMAERTVILCEDNPKLGEIYTTWLGDTYAVEHVDTGDGLLASLDQATDAIVTDWRTPGTQRHDLLSQIAESQFDPALVVISGIEPRIDLSDHGVDAFLEKPFRRDALLGTLDSLLQPSAQGDRTAV